MGRRCGIFGRSEDGPGERWRWEEQVRGGRDACIFPKAMARVMGGGVVWEE